MTGKELKIWLVTHGYTQSTLATALNVHVNTINNYCRSSVPVVVQMALKTLEIKHV